MNRKLKRSTLAAIEDWWNGNHGGGRDNTPEPPTIDWTFVGVNTSNAVITPGDLVAVTGFYPSTITYQRAKKLCFENRLKLSVTPTYPASGNAGVAVALTGAKSGQLVYFKDAYQATYFADVNGATGDYVTKEGNATTDESQAVSEILFSTAAANGRRVALCMLVPPDSEMTPEEVRAKLRTTSGTFVTGVTFTTDNRYLYISNSSSTAVTSVLANTQ